MTKTSALLAFLLLAGAATAQQRISLETQASPRKFTQDSAPAACTVGDEWFDSNATAGRNKYGCTATNTWTLQGDGNDGGAGGAGAITELSDLSVVRTNSTTLTVGTDCLTTAPCLVRVGNTIYSFSDGPITLTAPTVTSGTVWLGVSTSGVLTAWHNFTALTCGTGITCSASASGFPTYAVPIWTWTGVSNAFEATGGSDQRALLGRERQSVAGTGISISVNANGQETIGLDGSAISAPGFTATGGGGVAGYVELTQGTANTPSANSVLREAPTSITTAYTIKEPTAVGTTGVVKVSVSGTVATLSHGALVAGDLPAASDTAQGASELATAAETTTGTDATRAVTPDGLAGSTFGLERIGGECIADATALTVADGKCYFPIPASLTGSVVESVEVFLGAAVSSSGAVTVDIDRCGAVATGIRCSGTNVSIFSTLATIDANEPGTNTAATASVINASNDDLATADYLRVNVDGAGTGTQGLYVWINVRIKP